LRSRRWIREQISKVQEKRIEQKRRTAVKNKLILGSALVVASMAFLPTYSFGADGASLYKTKCAGCHGANGEGKPALKAPAVKGTSLTADQLVQHITKGEATSKAPHNKGVSGLNDADAKSIADFIKTLK
jgi:cytochrome c553